MRMNTRRIIEQIRNILWESDELQKLNDTSYLNENKKILLENMKRVSGSFSGSWIGYHSRVYYYGFRHPEPGDHFSSEWGFQDNFMAPTSNNWQERTLDEVQAALFAGVDAKFRAALTDVSERASTAYNKTKDNFKSILAILMEDIKTDAIKEIAQDFGMLSGPYSENKIANALKPGQVMTRDSLAMSQGLRVPPHISTMAWLKSTESPFQAILELSQLVRRALNYLELREEFNLTSETEKGNKIFIGHGRSPLWRELKDFLQDRLRVPWEEFNREPVAGLTTVERLTEMLSSASFALLIMTAEDEHVDSTFHARENVIHEIGLFQGRLGYRRAIVLLEEGCSEFSNIIGLSQIRFHPGRIAACFEEIRQVLAREGLINNG
jgi:predicted nucleotide-binding protein